MLRFCWLPPIPYPAPVASSLRSPSSHFVPHVFSWLFSFSSHLQHQSSFSHSHDCFPGCVTIKIYIVCERKHEVFVLLCLPPSTQQSPVPLISLQLSWFQFAETPIKRHCVDSLHFFYPSICWCASSLGPLLTCCEWRAFGYVHRRSIAGHLSHLFLVCWETPFRVPQWLDQFTQPPTVMKGSSSSTASAPFVVLSFLDVLFLAAMHPLF